MRNTVVKAGLEDLVFIDSAGTAAYHAGEPPDHRATRAALARGIRLTHKAQAFGRDDFARFDHVLAMDQNNLSVLQALAPSAVERVKVELFRRFDPSAERNAEVPDPYYGGARGFDEVLDMAERAANGLLAHLRTQYRL